MITVSPEAADKLRQVLSQYSFAYLRICVSGGGCSGLVCGLAPASEKNESDKEYLTEGINFIVDPVSLFYLKDAVLVLLESGHLAIDAPKLRNGGGGCSGCGGNSCH